jgi:uncharacterized repeat protein (TIGR01451 family)
MKRTLFRISVVGAVVGLGLLAIAHAQRPVADPPAQDDVPPNPARQDPPADNPPPDYRAAGPGPVDTAPADTAPQPRENPLRRDPPGGGPQWGDPQTGTPLPDRRAPPQNGRPNYAPMRIQLVAGEEPVDGTTGAPASGTQPGNGAYRGNTQVTLKEPQLMPGAEDRYAIPAQGGANAAGPRFVSPPAPGGAFPDGPRMVSPEPVAQRQDGSGGPSYDSRDPDAAQSPSGTGQPGDKRLEGPQNARVTLEKIVPPEIQVGRPAVLRTVVRNAGPAAAAEVEVRDQVPRGTRLLGAAPPAAQGRNGELVWSLGTLKPGGETAVEMQIVPIEEGEVGSVATVRFQTVATARSVVTRPKLVVQTAGPPRVLAGDETMLTFTVSNPGSGVATGVALIEHIPAGLKHPAGAELEYNVGDLKPGESRQMQIRLKAVQAGTISNVILARGDANLRAEHRFNFEVASAKLDVAMNGPKRRYLEREATYQLSVANPGTAPAKNVELVAYLPQGLKFVSANNAGRYDANTRAVYWQMDELPVHQQGAVELVTLPVAAGQFNLKVHSAAQRGLVCEKEQPVLVEGLAAVQFQLSHTKDPLEVGGETTYEISVINQGSKASTNLQMAVFLPSELRPLAAEGPTKYTIRDNKVLFESLPQLAPKSVAAFRVRAKGIRPGDLRVRCQLLTDEMQQPVVKEESTRVYADE